MSKATRHPDGGTVRTLKVGYTSGDGWAIVLTEWMTYKGNVVHEILRYSPASGRSFRVQTVRTGEADARTVANAWWRFERGEGPHPLHGAPVAVGANAR